MSMVWQNFHFLRPEWLWALLPLVVLVALYRRAQRRQSGWQGVIASHLYQQMVLGKPQKPSFLVANLLAACGLFAILAMAGPTWERLPQPVYQVKAGQVVVMDMSLSMRATDVSPDRLTRARYKAIDLVKALSEGETGLVVYAGDAFIISPLTADYRNLEALIPSLSPEIMPEAGSDPYAGLTLADELLANAGYQQGNIVWITDGVGADQMAELQELLADAKYTVHVLGVGTAQGAPIAQQNGELVKDDRGQIVVPKLIAHRLEQLAGLSGGTYTSIQANDQDIRALTRAIDNNALPAAQAEDGPTRQGDQWQEMGPYLVLMLLPLMAWLFRRGLVLALVAVACLPVTPSPALAQSPATADTPAAADVQLSWWQRAFNNANQQGDLLYEQGAYSQAADTYTDPTLSAAALYQAGDYAAAQAIYSQQDTAEAHYNRANALAQQGQFADAIAAYDEALARQADYPDARHNKQLVEKLLEQQQQQQEQQSEQNQQDSSSGDQEEQQQAGNESSADNQQNSGGESDPSQASGQDGAQDNSTDPAQSGGQQTPPQQPDPADNQRDEQSAQQPGDEPPADKAQTQAAEQERDGQAEQQESAPETAATSASNSLSDAEQENLQRMENLKRRVPDDPAFLLKRKMQLEAQRRQQRRPPADRREW